MERIPYWIRWSIFEVYVFIFRVFATIPAMFKALMIVWGTRDWMKGE